MEKIGNWISKGEGLAASMESLTKQGKHLEGNIGGADSAKTNKAEGEDLEGEDSGGEDSGENLDSLLTNTGPELA